jgi:hypothetical protein
MEFKFAIVHTMHTHILFWVPNTYYVLHSMENTNHVAFTLREVYKSSVSCYVVVVVVVVVVVQQLYTQLGERESGRK